MLKEYFLKLFRYNEWANQQVLDAVSQANAQPRPMLNLLGHIASTQEIWLARILNTDTQHQANWPEYDLETIKQKLPESSEEWAEFIETMNDEHLKEEHQYSNSKGKLFKTTLEDVVLHVINHATHHRAQLVKMLRDQGEEPPVTDYIFYSREAKA